MKEALDEAEELEEKYLYGGAEGYYYHLMMYKEESNPEYIKKWGEMDAFLTKLGNDVVFFALELGKIPKEKQEEFLKSDLLKKYKHHLENLFENAKYHLSEGEEKILALKSRGSYELWERMTASLLSKETRKVLVDSSGKMEEKTYNEMSTLMESNDKKIRDSSAKAFQEIKNKYEEVAEF